MNSIALYGYLISAVLFTVFSLLFLLKARLKANNVELSIAMIAGACWAGVGAYDASRDISISLLFISIEQLRNIVWSFLFFRLLTSFVENIGKNTFLIASVRISIGLPILILILLTVISFSNINVPILGYDLRILMQLLQTLLMLSILEQLFRHAREYRHLVKQIFIIFASILLYDFICYSDSLLFREIDADLWVARAYVSASFLPFMVLVLNRLPDGRSLISISREIVFHFSIVIVLAVYLLFLSFSGYFLQLLGGDWEFVLKNVLIFTSLIFVLVLVFSRRNRAILRAFIDKHMLSYKYDYREEWSQLIHNLSAVTDEDLEKESIKSLARIVNSESGSIWLRTNKDSFYQSTELGGFPKIGDFEPTNSSMINFLNHWQWVINLDDVELKSEIYEDLDLPKWIEKTNKEAWLIVPLMVQDRVYGFIVIGKPVLLKGFDWEDITLLKTAGREVAMHLAHARSSFALIESRQFEAFNRLSAYVMHDLKNLMSQLSLIVRNAEKHKHKPEFIDDTIKTVENSVNRMNNLLAQLKGVDIVGSDQKLIKVVDILNLTIKDKEYGSPVPELKNINENIRIEVDVEKIVSILGHVVQNAQDATDKHGYVKLSCVKDSEFNVIEVEDNGVGMDQAFIDSRLFKPFDSTKGLTGMGIGAHDVKQYIEKELKGIVEVKSELEIGTVFRIKIPVQQHIAGTDSEVGVG